MTQPYSGKLIVVEGIDGSGKSTQIRLLERWLVSRGYSVFFTEWNSSLLVRETTRYAKKKDLLTPTTFSLLHATDFADRHQDIILPPLKAGMVVLADRYVYTAFARDAVRGVHPQWIRDLYSFAVQPDLTLYFRVPLEVATRRIAGGRGKIKYHEAGMDLRLSTDIVESFKIFQGRILEEYDRLAEEFQFTVFDATKAIEDQQEEVRDAAVRMLRTHEEKLHGIHTPFN
ncbi:MAG: dTMP kinase [Candidatus Brocadiae bacterium]|nr:dTMP kinase [Candidatus Brocadiia bacterium]